MLLMFTELAVAPRRHVCLWADIRATVVQAAVNTPRLNSKYQTVYYRGALQREEIAILKSFK